MERKTTIEGGTVPSSDISVIVLLIEQLNAVVPLNYFEHKLTSSGPAPQVFRYRFDTIDGRTWRQDITFDDLANPLMTFSQVQGTWRVSEFAAHRSLRDWMVKLTKDYAVTKFRYDFLVA